MVNAVCMYALANVRKKLSESSFINHCLFFFLLGPLFSFLSSEILYIIHFRNIVLKMTLVCYIVITKIFLFIADD